jgi:S-methylmethionine-dependent homocysteine/selenocysteine methylase
MPKTQTTLPHASEQLFLTDGGLETTLVFLQGFELPYFAAFDLLKNKEGYTALRNYYLRYLNIAKDFKSGFILESPTWRANPDWIKKLGYPESSIEDINAKAVRLLTELKATYEDEITGLVISGCIGPRGDGYKPEYKMTVEDAQNYHAAQIEVFSHTPIDLVTAITMNNVEEAIGIARAAGSVQLPVVISFTVETDGKLPTGMSLGEAITQVDEAVQTAPLYYMINCAHPTHFSNDLQAGRNEGWTSRIKGIRANASCRSHAELDEASELDRGNPEELSLAHKRLKMLFPQLNVFGGCCGTDEEHVLAIARQVATAPA